MGFLKKLLGKQDDVGQEQVFNDPSDVVVAYDKDGNEFAIGKKEYRESVLPSKFAEVGDDPDKLYDVIVISLNDGFFEECLGPANRLIEIDRQSERSAAILSITLMKNGRLAEAKTTISDFLLQQGESGIMLTNLAKVQAEEGDYDSAHQTLWNALNVDPNQKNGLDWFAAIARENEGEDGFYKAMERVSEISGSWRPQLWLARRLVENKKIDSAIELYRSVLEFKELPHDVYMMISGDLGNSGYLLQVVELLDPIYDVEVHGAMAGINLMHALHRLGDKQRALEICNSLERLDRFDLMTYLKECRSELEK